MNRMYKVVWNASLGAWVAVSEIAKSKTKTKSIKSIVISLAALSLISTASAADPDITASNVTASGIITASEIQSTGNIAADGDIVAKDITASGTLVATEIRSISNIVADGNITAQDITATGVVTAGSIKTTGNINAAQVTVDSEANLTANNKQVVTGGQLFTTNKRVSKNETDIAGSKADIVQNKTDITTNENNITAIKTSLENLGVDENKQGIKYFRVKSKKDDSRANGEDSVAIGPESVSEGKSSIAAGHNAETAGDNSIALGNKALAEGKSNIALGHNAKVANKYVNGAIAIGEGASVNGQDSLGAIALGKEAEATAGKATALGAGAQASGANAIALGGAIASGSNSLGAGVGAQALTQNSIVLGTNAGVGTNAEVNDSKQRHSHIIIGKNAGNNIDGNEAIAIGVGAGSNSIKSQQIAIGSEAGTHLNGTYNVSLGYKANSYGSRQVIEHSTALGGNTKAMSNAVAVGYNANAATDAVAIGAGAEAEEGNIALGSNSHAVQSSGAGYLTGKAPKGGTVSVGNADTGLTRRITNVEDGATGYDAVNVRQLEKLKEQLGSFIPESGGNVNYNKDETITVAAGKEGGHAVNLAQMNTAIADSKPKYISINPNGDSGNEDGYGALGVNSANSMAIGHGAKVEDSQGATALGYRVSAKGNDSTALGSQSTVDNASGVAIGHQAYSRGENSLAFGTDAETERQATGASSDNAIAIGTSARASNNDATAMGHRATASGEKSSALGYLANASATSAMAFGTESAASATNSQASGTRAKASAVDSQASGTDAKAFAERGIAMGQGARSGEANPEPHNVINNRDSIAIGSESVAEKNSSTAMGRNAKATANYAQAFGESAQASGVESIAQGRNTLATAEKAIAVGWGAKSTAVEASAFGSGANAAAKSALALGSGATAQNTNSVAIGAGAKAENNRSVALGDSSVTAGAVGTSSATLNKLTYGDFAGDKPIATVSVGTSTEKRTITNVAAGQISKTSTDAINGSQLHATNSVLGNVANTTKNILGGNAELKPNGSLSMSNVGDTGKNNIHDAIKYAAQGWNVQTNDKAAAKVAPGETVKFIDGENVKITSDGKAITVATKDDVTFNNTTINNDLTVGGTTKLGDNFTVNNDNSVTYTGPITEGNHITNKTYVDKVGAASRTEVEAGTNVADVKAREGGNGQTIYTVNAKGTTATAGSDAITVEGTTDNTTNITDYKVDLSQDTKDSLVKADTALQEVVTQIDGTAVKTIKQGDNTANFVSGDNIELSDDGNGGIKVATKDDVTFNNTTINNDLTVGGTTKLGDDFTVNNDNRVTYKGQEIANKADGLSFKGNTGGAITKNLGDKQPLTISGELAAGKASSGANLRVDGGTNELSLVMARDLTDLDSATFGKDGNRFTINEGGVKFVNKDGEKRDNTPSITAGGIDGGKNTITGVGSGLAGSTLEGATGDTLFNAVNVGDLQNSTTGLINKGFNIAADNGDEDNVKLGETVKYTSTDGNIVTTVSDNTIDFGLGKDLTVGDDQNPGTIVVKGKDGKDGVTIDGEDGTIGLNGKDGANGTISVKNGVPGVDGQDGITRIVIDDIEVATMEDGLKFAGNTGDTINKKLNETLTVKGELAETEDASGANLRVDSDGNNLNLVMARDLTDLNSITINNGGPVINQDGINMNSKKITNLAPGVDGTDAVNVSQLTELSNDVSQGLSFAGDDYYSSTVINRKLGQTLNITGGAIKPLSTGNIGVVANGDKLEVKLAEEIDLGDNGSVTVGDSVVNNNGLTITGGPSVTKDGIDAGDKKITGVAKGDISKDSTDAVNGSQLWEVKNDIDKDVAASKTEVEEGKNITVTETKGTDGQTIYEVSTSDEVEFDKVDVGSVSIDKNKVDKDGNTIISGVGAGKADTDAVNVGQLKDVVAGANKGFNVTAQGENESNVANGGSIDFNNTDGNIKVEKATDSNDISFNLNPNLDLGKEGSITTGDTIVDNSGVTTGNTSMTNNGIIINNAKPDSKDYDENKTVSVTDKGLNNGGNRITNVGPGVDGTDAVNINQLKDFGYNLSNKIDKVGDEANAGVSSAMAMAALPQAYIPGKSMVTGGMATYNGQGAVAVGVSKLSDNGRWVLKISGSADTEGNAGGAVGAGFHF